MGASSSCCFSSAKAEESPCAENNRVAELERVRAEGASTSGRSEDITKAEASPSTVVDPATELAAMTVVGAEGASTSGRSEYYSELCEAMKRSRSQFSDDVEMEIECWRSQWSEESCLEVAPQSAEEKELNRKNRKLLEQLVEQYPDLFQHDLDRYVLGPKIAYGGQADIYEVVDHPNFVMKVFRRGTSLRDLRRQWPALVLMEGVRQCIVHAGILQDGRFAFFMEKYWGDLRKLIDQAMLEKNVNGIQCPPFPYKCWMHSKRWTFYPVDFILGIAEQMLNIHEANITHRDLKASNVLVRSKFDIVVADFESSIGVVGTGFWRAPEILVDPRNSSSLTSEQWKKADVYCYGMTCFEIMTGQIPFEDELRQSKVDYQLVIEGKRPKLPSDLDDVVKDLITKCWEPNPNLRPTFFEIVAMVKSIPT